MSAFQVNITPIKTKSKTNNEGRSPTDVIMAPFSAKAIVQFEDVPVTKTATRILNIINPSDADIMVTVTKVLTPDHNLAIDWTEKVIPKQGVSHLSLVWCPQRTETLMESMQLTDNRNFRKDVTIILKSVSSNPAKIVRKFPTVSSSFTHGSHAKNLRLQSPTGGYKIKPILQGQQRRRLTQLSTSEVKKTKSEKKDPKPSWNGSACFVGKKVIKSNPSPLTERNVYINNLNFEKSEKYFQITRKTANKTIKENISPLSPGVVMDIFDRMQFTPIMDSVPNNKANLTLPSPWALTLLNERKLQPRRLIVDDIHERANSPVACQKIPSIEIDFTDNSLDENKDQHKKGRATPPISNKTFELNINDKRDITISPSHGGLASSPNRSLVLNKTTTIVVQSKDNALASIQEEESPTSTIFLQKTFNMSKVKTEENLLRDVRLVGTPLRKFSESLRDLSGRSPQSRISIQGSMPNLNDMDNIQSIEKNRYFYKVEKTSPVSQVHLKAKHLCLDDSRSSSTSQSSLASHIDYPFNYNEILAQSSRFNLHELGKKSCKSSPNSMMAKGAIKKEIKSPMSSFLPKTSRAFETHENTGFSKRFREQSSHDSPVHETIPVNYLTLPTESCFMQVSPPKRTKIDPDVFPKLTPIKSSTSSRVKKWSHVQPKKYRLSRTLSLVRKPITPRKTIEESRIKLYDSDMYLLPCINPDPFAATTTIDPFLASTMYLDERAVDRHQIEFKKWLNALVSIPADLEADCDKKVDVGKLFNEVRNKDLVIAPTKEEQSMNYLTQYRLESLRRAAVQLFLSEEMRVPCSKVAVYVNKNAIRIRNDRNLHLDVVMQRYILELLLCFNPLWLRLGLEVVYGEKIHLQSCSDVVGLSTFILNRLFKDKFLEQKYSKAYTLSEEYANHIKQFTLQKMLFLLLFLDKAKAKKIIKHNPCLFVKKSPHKETKEILLRFSCELLANVGDITRELRRLGYVLTHKQSFLDEFDYAFNNLAVDLRDGIRLTRIMEIILLRDDLTSLLRCPAISRLQRIYNVNLALRSLAEADFKLKGDISAADIVDGHREKTLSLLWQIIYKFRSPKFHAAATVIQRWWRKSWLRVFIRRMIQLKEEQRRNAAATIIQAAFRGYVCRKFTKVYRMQLTQVAVICQKYIRRYLAQVFFYRCLKAIICIQNWFRAVRKTKMVRQEFILCRTNTIFLQRWFRRILFVRKLQQSAIVIKSIQIEVRLKYEKAIIIQNALKSFMIRRKLQSIVHEVVHLQRQTNIKHRSASRIQSFFRMIQERRAFQTRRKAAKKIQSFWWSSKLAKILRAEFISKRNSIIRVQQKYRANKMMREQRADFLKLRNAVILIQTKYRAKKLAEKLRGNYLQSRNAAIVMQRRFRSGLLMKTVRQEYLQQRKAIILCQQRFRATQRMKSERAIYEKQRSAAIYIQRFYRSRMEIRSQRAIFKRFRELVIRIQQKLRATLLARKLQAEYISLYYYTIIVQQTFRAKRQMRIDRAVYLKKKQMAIFIQRRFRANSEMKVQRDAYLQLRNSATIIQRKFRGYQQMRIDNARFQGRRRAIMYIQQRFRDYRLMKNDRGRFLQQKRAAVAIQRRYRAYKSMQAVQERYRQMQKAATCLQRRFRARQLMIAKRSEYQKCRNVIVAIQKRYRTKVLTRATQKSYQEVRDATLVIQRRFRAQLQMRINRDAFDKIKQNIIKIQRYFRAYLAMKKQRAHYCKMQSSAIYIQSWYRSVLQMQSVLKSYNDVRQKIITIQLRWKAELQARQERKRFLFVKQKIILIQTKLRATLQMRRTNNSYKQLQNAAIIIQRRYRARQTMLQLRSQFLLIKSLILCIQRKFRATKAMRLERNKFLLIKSMTIRIQQRYRSRLQMKADVKRLRKLKETALGLQTFIRGYLARLRYRALMTPEMKEFLLRKKAAKIIQCYWRGYRIRKKFQNSRIRKIRYNLKTLRKTSQAIDSIRYKLQESVRILRGRFIASDALYALMQLDRCSRTVPHLLMGHCDFFSAFCYGIMAQAIRSEIDKQLIELCSRVILNLARYNSTTANTFQEGGLVTIAQMLMRWCDKDCEIFNTLCTLIWIFAHSPEKRKKIRKFMTTPEALYLLRETKKLVARKEKMKMNARNSIAANSNFPPRALPSLQPDFGVIRRHPYIFVSAVFAFDTVLAKLGIDNL